jgi:hypothetical protein
VAWSGEVFGGTAQRLAEQKNHNNDDEQEADRASAKRALARNGVNKRCMAYLSFLMAICLPSLSGVTLRDGPVFSYGV